MISIDYDSLRVILLNVVLFVLTSFILHCEQSNNTVQNQSPQSTSEDAIKDTDLESNQLQIGIEVLPNDQRGDFTSENNLDENDISRIITDEDLNDLLHPLDESKENLNEENESSDPSEMNLIESLSSISPNEQEACAKLLSISPEKIMLTENLEHLKIESQEGLAIKINSTTPDIEVNLTNVSIDKPGYLAGICVFAKSADTKIFVNIDTHVNRIIHIAKQENINGKYIIGQNGVVGLVVGDLTGDNTNLALTGDGAYACSTALMRLGSQTSEFHCP